MGYNKSVGESARFVIFGIIEMSNRKLNQNILQARCRIVRSAYGVDTFFFIAGNGGINNANYRSQWVNLSTYNPYGDSYLFQLFPVGTDERVSLDKGNFRAGAINADQSSVITAESNVIFNRYCLGDLQPDGSVAFNDANIKNPTPIVFNSDFTVGNMFARINSYVDFQFADADSITLTAK